MTSRQVIKVFFREEGQEMDDVEVVKLDEDVLEEIRDELENSRKCMIEATDMGEWKVGYLAKE
jgi:hypothetical protein